MIGPGRAAVNAALRQHPAGLAPPLPPRQSPRRAADHSQERGEAVLAIARVT
jgi:hypothetical protein